MHSLQKQFHDFISDQQLVGSEDRVLLAVSGGLDSMVMAHLFLDSSYSFGIAHCNFGLRGEESDRDEAFVIEWAEKNEVEIHAKRFELGDGSIQLEARKARYAWFEYLAATHGFTKIATAHHLDDSLETTLINLTRGTGIHGLKGVATINGDIIRPMMFAAREDIERYAKDKHLRWREDSSNKKMDYDRNLLRHEVVPHLKKLNPSLLGTFQNTSERLSFASEILKDKVLEARDVHFKQLDTYSKLSLEWLEKGSDQLILSELLAPFGFNYVTCKEIVDAKDSPGKSFATATHHLTIDRGCAIITSSTERNATDFTIADFGTYQVNKQILDIRMVDSGSVSFGDQNTGFFNAEQLIFPLRIRSWAEGDRMQPLGMKGTKKVSDMLIDAKVPRPLKDEVLVLESAGKIAWLMGIRISEEFKMVEGMERVIKIEIKPGGASLRYFHQEL